MSWESGAEWYNWHCRAAEVSCLCCEHNFVSQSAGAEETNFCFECLTSNVLHFWKLRGGVLQDNSRHAPCNFILIEKSRSLTFSRRSEREKWNGQEMGKIAQISFLICRIDYCRALCVVAVKSSHSGKFHAGLWGLRNFNMFLIRFVKSECKLKISAYLKRRVSLWGNGNANCCAVQNTPKICIKKLILIWFLLLWEEEFSPEDFIGSALSFLTFNYMHTQEAVADSSRLDAGQRLENKSLWAALSPLRAAV